MKMLTNFGKVIKSFQKASRGLISEFRKPLRMTIYHNTYNIQQFQNTFISNSGFTDKSFQEQCDEIFRFQFFSSNNFSWSK